MSDSSDNSWETLRKEKSPFFNYHSPSPIIKSYTRKKNPEESKPKVRRRLLDIGNVKNCDHEDRILPDISPPKLEESPKALKSFVVSSPISQIRSFPKLDLSRISPRSSHTDIMREVRLKPSGSSKESEKAVDIIVLDDNDETPNKKKTRFAEFNKELCTFERETITEHDYKTLADEEFLNDNIINFYLTWLVQTKLSTRYKEMVHIYSSHFYTRLRSKPKKCDKKTKAEMAYEKVKGWTKKINIFEKRMLVFPICEESHWYLVIVCNPGHVLSQSREKDFETKRSYQQKYGETKGYNPFIMVLDSLGGNHSSAISKIRQYLSFEHLEKRKLPLNFGKEKMGEKHPPIPYQPNSCDCGLFLLHYVELIFKDPEMFLGAMLPDLSKWFNTSEIDGKREEIAMLIQKIAQENNSSNNIRFPRIRFPPKHKIVISDDEDGEIGDDDDEEDKPLRRPQSRSADPRLRKKDNARTTRFSDDDDEEEDAPLRRPQNLRPDPKLRKKGSLGELLASKSNGRATRFKGSYRVPSPPRSPSASPSSIRSPKLFESPQKVSFSLKKKVHSPKTPDFGSSWESVKDKSYQQNGKRFTLKRNNTETDPETIKCKDRPVSSKQEMYDILMKSTSKKKQKMMKDQ